MLDAGFNLALERLRACPEFARLIPEVRSNLAWALPGARGPADVIAVEGRITVVAGRPCPAGPPAPGASDHMARLVVELGRRDPMVRAGVNFASNPRLDRWLAAYAEARGWVFAVIDRAREPGDLEREDRPSTPWKVEEAVRACGGRVPKLLRETAAVGKEPLSFLVGPDPVTVVDEACALARAWSAEAGDAYLTRWPARAEAGGPARAEAGGSQPVPDPGGSR
ncbi:MAG: thiamine-phosphate synthase family protein [bacterium]